MAMFFIAAFLISLVPFFMRGVSPAIQLSAWRNVRIYACGTTSRIPSVLVYPSISTWPRVRWEVT